MSAGASSALEKGQVLAEKGKKNDKTGSGNRTTMASMDTDVLRLIGVGQLRLGPRKTTIGETLLTEQADGTSGTRTHEFPCLNVTYYPLEPSLGKWI